MTDYQPKYKWRVTWPADAESHRTDFQGWDGDIALGRIRFEPHGPKEGMWQWSGHGPDHGLRKGRILPQQGCEPTAREACAMAEGYYDRLMAHNGLKVGKHER